jgi:hypothetical protein
MVKCLDELVKHDYVRVHQIDDLVAGRVPMSDRMLLVDHENAEQTATMIVECIGPRLRP